MALDSRFAFAAILNQTSSGHHEFFDAHCAWDLGIKELDFELLLINRPYPSSRDLCAYLFDLREA